MHRKRTATVFFLAAGLGLYELVGCSSSDTTTPPATTGGSAGTAGKSQGGAAGTAGKSQGGAAGTAGKSQGGAAGTAGKSQGGAAGTSAGGTAGAGLGGTGGASEGGTAGSVTGGTAGTSAGGTGGGALGGAAGTGPAGSAGAAGLPVVGGCTVFTGNDDWNADISNAAVDAQWTANLMALVGDIHLHPDFGNWGGEQYGIPINVVPQSQPLVNVSMDWYEDESDPGPYPFPDPSQVQIEGGDPYSCGGDCHLLVVQQGTCKLYEGYACQYQSGWHCGNGAIWDLTTLSYGQRPMGWTSADAAGLAIMPGLIRYDEVVAGEIHHAIRFTTHCSRSKYVKPATHYAVPDTCPDSPNHPPMGLRVRLKADFDIAPYNASAQAILKAMKRYGMILADNGSDFFFQAETNPGWNDDVQQLKDVPANAFEVIVPPPLQP